MKELHIAVLPGDGIGPEVVEQALNVTLAVGKKFGHTILHETAPVGACAIEETGSPYPDSTHELCMRSDAVLFGAIGSPKYDNNPNAKVRPEQGLLAMRKKLGLFANIRPITTFPGLIHKSPLRAELIDGADFMCIRELTGGLYFGRPQGRSEDGSVAYDTCMYSREEITRIVQLAYDYAMRRRKKVTMVDKANILATSRLWREVTQEIAAEYPEVETEFLFVDNAAMRMIQWPKSFDVIVTENMFGDILTDEGSVITGSLGMLPSASIGLHTSVFEPIHGSYPQAAGKDIANPLATILSTAMMFEYAFDLKAEADLIRQAVAESMKAGIVTEDIADPGAPTCHTHEVGEWIVKWIEQH
ncbi:3-isopropylmalate dehydrogenase [Barnesiella sp. An22]|uniref:3-isopropylmalate dehydrogenase n=1 Tax=Barnesiella sp. An22 TaxID=1965590 RepID=UPI000B3ABB5C|nr:3-isopropylmalate dehydrogenase [Barnesiella sp. An22]OUO99494.1 3-isopropylmalate dehydrogenase [Barnesiella sp. An22]